MAFWNRKSDDDSTVSQAGSLTKEKLTKEKTVTEKPEQHKSMPNKHITKATTSAEVDKVKTNAEQDSSSSKPESTGNSFEDYLIQKFGRIRSALGNGTVIQGKLSFDTPVRIDGKLSGEIFSSKALIVGPTGQIDAKVEVACLVVLGSVKGNVKATERIELLAGAQLEGEIQTQTLVIESGARFSGACGMGGKARFAAAQDTKVSNSETTVINDPNVDLASVLAGKDAKKDDAKKDEVKKASTSEAGKSETVTGTPSLQ